MADVQDALIEVEPPSLAAADTLDPCLASAEAAVNTGPTSPRLQRIRSLSCSILPDVRQSATQEVFVTADDASERSSDSAPPVDTPSITSAELSAADALNPQLLRQHRHHHKRNHKHRHGHHRLSALATDDASRSTSTEDLVQAQQRLYSSEGNLLTLLEGRKAKSFTGPTRPHQPHHQQYTTAPGLGLRPSAGTGVPRNTNNPQTRHILTNSAGTSPPTMAHVVVAGRRSPALGAQKQPGHQGSYQKQQGYSGGGSGGADKYIAAVLGKAAMQKSDRTFAERVKPEDIAKGFGAHWFSRHSLDVFNGSRPAASAKQIIGQVPAYAGLHLWVVRPPRSRQWVPVHLGSADNLQQALAQYIHEDGSCGPASEPFKHRVILDLMARGFAVQVRYRPLKHKHATAKADEVCKLQRFDFPLNDKDNGGCRPIELPNGWQVVEYPAVNKDLNKLLDRSFWTRRVS